MRVSVVRSHLALLLVALGLCACTAPPPAHGPRYDDCVAACARQKDACMIEATNASAVTACDAQSRQCGGQCQ